MEQFYKIAGLTVKMDSFGRTVTQAEPYRCAPAEEDIVISSRAEQLREKQPHLSLEDCEYLSTGGSFYRQLLKFDGMMLHASAVVMDGYAYLFSAPCGTGKSTHTSLWRKVFGDDRAKILNDDKPALRLIDGKWYACGTPWSGKTDQNINMMVPVAGICFLRRGEKNTIEPFSGKEAIHAVMEQTARSASPQFCMMLLGLLDRLLQDVPVWQMHCNMELDAPQVSYAAMSAAIKNKGE